MTRLSRPNGRCWYLATGYPGGRIQKHYFRTESEANGWAEEENRRIERAEEEALRMPRRLLLDARDALDLLEGTELTLTQAAKEAIRRAAIQEGSIPFPELVTRCLEMTKKSVERKEKSADHLANFKKAARALLPVFGQRLASEITKADLVRWLDSLDMAPASKDFYRRYALMLFSFALDRGFVKTNPAADIPKFRSAGEIEILTVPQVKALLAAAPLEMIPYYAVGLFAGLRPHSEIRRLKWSAFDWADRIITVPNFKTMSRGSARNRHVAMSANLMAWLEPFRAARGDVWPVNWFRLHYATLKKAGIKHWPHDAMRRSYASYLLALCQDAAKVASEMGHEGTQMIYKRYRRLVKPTEAAAFWEIYPPWHQAEALPEK